MNVLMKTFLTYLNLSAVLFLSSCGTQEVSDLANSGVTVSWTEWCPKAKLADCAAQPATISQEQWVSSLNVARAIVSSPSKIVFGRADLNRSAVQNLFTVTGAEDILHLVNQIPWQNLGIGAGTVEMNNLGAKGQISINSLSLISTGRSQFSWKSPLMIDVTGVVLGTPAGEQLNLLKIDLSKSGRLTFVTNLKTIKDVPVNFFSLKKLVDSKPSSVDSVIRAISDVVFEPGFNWRDAINVTLNAANISSIRSSLSRPDAGPVLKIVDGALGNSKNFWVGGPFRKEVLSLELNSGVDCSMKFTNVPLLGTVNANLSFAKTFGLATMLRQDAKVVSKVYGITTSLGNLDSVTLDGSKIVLKLGVFSIPLDLSSKDTSGPEVSNIQCINRA